MSPSVRTVRPAQLSHWDLILPEQLEPVSTCGSGHPSGASLLFLITTIWLIGNSNSVKRG